MRRYDTLLKNTKNAREDLRRRNPGKSEAEIDNIAIKEQIDDLAAKLSDQESFSKMTKDEKRGAMKDYLFLKSMQQPSINAQVGSLLHKDINDDKQLEKLLDKFIEKVPDGKDVLKELNDKQLLFFASSSYLNDDILADQKKKEEMALYEQDLDANGIQGVRVRREAAAEALRKEHAEKEAHLKSMEKLERDVRKKELDEGKKAFEEHRKKIRKTANGKIVAGGDGFDRDSFKQLAFKNGWNEEIDSDVLDSMYDVYESVTGKYGTKVDLDNFKDVENAINDAMYMKGDMKHKYEHVFGKIAQAVSRSTVVDPSASSELDELIEEQKEAFKELERKKELSSGPTEPSFNDIIAMRNSSAPKKKFAVEENLDEYRQKTTGLNASKWFMIGHDDSVEIQKLRKTSNELEKALETKSFLVESKMIDAYKASMAYQQKVRKQAGIPFSNKDWKPRSGVGQKRYEAAKNIEEICRKWISPDIIKRTEEAAKKESREYMIKKKAENYTSANIIPKMMSEAQSKLKKSAAKLDKNGDCTGCAKDVARVLAVRSVIDSINSAPKRKSEPVNKVEFIKAVKIRTAAYMERDDFRYMISGMTPKKAVESSKNNGGMLKEKLSAAGKELSKLQKQVERTKSEPILEKRRVSVLGG